MTERVEDFPERLALLNRKSRFAMAGLFLVRYCRIYGDSKFSPWYSSHQRVLEEVDRLARQLAAVEAIDTVEASIMRIYEHLDEIINESDPDGPPFEIGVVDHLVFVTEVFDALEQSSSSDILTHVAGRAEELAESAEEFAMETMGAADYRGSSGFVELERDICNADVDLLLSSQAEGRFASDALISRSLDYSHSYSRVFRSSYSDQDAGRY